MTSTMTSTTTPPSGQDASPASDTAKDPLLQYLQQLHLHYIAQHYQSLARQAGEQHWSHLAFLTRLMEGEAHRREQRSVERRIKLACFPVLKSLDQFQWSWPKKINRPQIQNLFRLGFLTEPANVVFIGTVGLGKSHLSVALGHTACLHGYSVLFTTAIDIINTMSAAQASGGLKRAMHRYVQPALLIIDELGYLPIDKYGADCLFQIISARYERGPIIITANRIYKHWSGIFNNDSTLTSALLDRLLHHANTVIIEGKSFRMKDQIESLE
jgi:DNA replication protein DnaC